MSMMQDKQLFKEMKERLYSAVICDTLDELGYRNQALREDICPLLEQTIVGRAKTILAADVYHIHKNPYEMEIKAIDSIKENEVVVAATNHSVRNGLWGELLSTASKMRGANGAIIDGLVRDVRKIKEIDFQVYCTGTKPVDSRGRGVVIDYDCPVEVGGIMVHPGDVVFADEDGVVIIPNKVLHEVFGIAIQKVESENNTRKELLLGKLLAEVYEKYGVL